MKEKFRRFMQGRYGGDELTQFLMMVILGLIVLNLFVKNSLISWLVLGILLYSYYRIFSRDISRRRAENQKFLNARYKLTCGIAKQKTQLQQRKIYHIYRCPQCRQKIRVPKGKGKIVVTCPKCRAEFQKKS